MSMKNKVAVITGSSRGIGRSIATEFAKNGALVVINFIDSQNDAMDALAEVKKFSDGICLKADVSNCNDVEHMKNEVIRNYGTLDILVNNAGVIPRPGNWEDIDGEAWNRTFSVNTQGVFNCIRVFSKYLCENEYGGKIVNISSTCGENGVAGVIAYSAAKAAVINMTKAFAKTFAPKVNVNAITPGNIATDMTKGAGDDLIQQIVAATPFKRLGMPIEVAYLTRFLCSDEASFITGQVISIDGGYNLP
jgi:3-oxoacyl-[acyl-carrier protein] reductase